MKPSLTELERFQETTDDLKKDLENMVSKEKRHHFVPGDNIEVMDGELVNLRGKVQSVDGDKIVIMPEHEDLKVFFEITPQIHKQMFLQEPLTLNSNELRKFFKIGDHVRVISGSYEGDTGMILRVEENFVIVFSDVTKDEVN